MRRGFTLVEMLVVISIIILLTAMTIGAINLSVTNEQVRSGARLIQSKIEGARDRGIYARDPRGIRILVNDLITETVGGNEVATTSATLVYIGSPGQDASQEDRDDSEDFNGDGISEGDGNVSELFRYIQLPDSNAIDSLGLDPVIAGRLKRAVIGTNTNWSELYSRGLIGPRSQVEIDGRRYAIDPRSFPISNERVTHNQSANPEFYGGLGGLGFNPIRANGFSHFQSGASIDEVLYLIWTDDFASPPMTSGPASQPWNTSSNSEDYGYRYSIQLDPDTLAGEESSVLPPNVVIDLETSHLPESWVTTKADGTSQFSNRMDILFSPSGAIIGEAGAAGLIHLHVCDLGDALANAPPGSQTLTGMPDGEPRNGSEFGITIFTRSGRVIVHPIDWGGYPVPGESFHDTTHPGYWHADSPYAAGDVVAPLIYNGNVYRCVEAGQSRGVGPQWNLAPGGLTIEGDLKWLTEKHNIWRLGLEGEVAR